MSDETKRGFAGLQSMVSNVDEIKTESSEDAELGDVGAELGDDGYQFKSSHGGSNEEAQNVVFKKYSEDKKQIRNKLFIIIIVLILFNPIFRIIVSSDKRSTTYSTPSMPSMSAPQYGTDRVLSISEIRYCEAEGIRLDAMRWEIDNNVSSEVDYFNRYVDDFNGRCGSFRYRDGSLESARRDIAKVQSILVNEGKKRIWSIR